MAGNPIKTPLSQRFRLWRRRILPIAVWIGAVLTVVVLFQTEKATVQRVVGVVEAKEAFISAPIDATLQAYEADLFEHVEAGQIVALFDTAVLDADIAVAEAQLAHLKAELDAALAEQDLVASDENAELRRFREAAEQARIAYQELKAELEGDRGTLEQVRQRLNRELALSERGLLDSFTPDQTRMEADALEARVRELEPAVNDALAAKNETAGRIDEYLDQLTGVSRSALIEPHRQAIAVQEQLIASLQVQRDRLHVRAPIAGEITEILYQPGVTLVAGTAVATITNPVGARVLAYVDERQKARLEPGDRVDVASRAEPTLVASVNVADLSPRVEMFPEHLANRVAPQWGQPILLDGLPEGIFRPGEAVTVLLPRER